MVMKTYLTAFILFFVFSFNIFAEYPYIRFEGHTGKVDSIALSSDDNTIASGGWDKTVRLWDIAAEKEIVTLTGHTGPVYSVALSRDGKMLASGSYDRTIRLWDVETHTNIGILAEHKGAVSSLAFSADGKILISGSYDRTIRLWDVETKTNIKTLTEHKGRVTSVVLSPDGKMFASSSWDKTVRLWDVETHTNITTFTEHTGDVMSVAFSPDGKTIAYGNQSGNIILWEIATAKKIGILGWYSSNTNWVMGIAFSPDGKTIAIAMHWGTIYLWDIATKRRIGSLYDRWDGKRIRSDTVNDIMFSSDGETIISCNWDSKIRLWNITRCFKITPHPIVSPAIGEQFTVSIENDTGPNLSVSKIIINFNEDSLRYIKATNGDLVKPSDTIETRLLPTFFDDIELKARFLPGKGTLANITFEVIDVRASQIIISDVDFYAARTPPYRTYNALVEPPQFPSSAVVSFTPSTVLSPAIGEQLVFNVNIADGQNVARSEFTLDFDQSALKHISSSEGNYFSEGVGNGNGTLERIIFEVLDVKDSTVGISGYLVTPNGFRYIPTFESAEIIEPLLGDVNRDGTVSILDLVQVASSLGQELSAGGNPADVNEDGVINIIDLITVAGAINDEAVAPARWSRDLQGVFTSDHVQKWLSQAQHLAMTDAISQRGMRFLENLLAALTPKKTALLPNYPNPFNPETWIPYQLAEPADVNISIYTADGAVVRTLAVGHQPKGIYHDKTRAVYWDGKNEVGDAVASGVYFYTLTAGKFKSTRKMLILK
jgi:WD40 repeat protein